MSTVSSPSPPSEGSASSPVSSGHIDDVLSCLNPTDATGTGKRKRSLAIDPYTRAARWIPLAIQPFISINNLMYAGLPYVEAAEEYTPEEVSLHEKVIKLVPTFKSTLEAFSEDPHALDAFITKLAHASNSARQEDSASLKGSILGYLLPEPTVDTLQPPLSISHGKSARRFNHPITAYYLCPVHLAERYIEDIDILQERVETGEIKVRAAHWPAFMYDFTNGYDPDDKQEGLCRGLLLVRVFRHIFTGPSSALGTPTRATKSPKAALHGLTAVTGRTIAYAAVQARFSLSSDEEWGFIDNPFNYASFYNNIVTLFEDDPEDPWVIKTLDWWNEQVPGLKPRAQKQRRHRQRQGPESGDDNAVNDILNQRKAARAKQTAQRLATGSVSPPPLPGQLRRPEPDGGIDAPPPPLPVHEVAPIQRIDRRAASPPPSPVQRAVQNQGVTQSTTPRGREDLDDDGTHLSPSASSRRVPPKFLARSRIIVDTPRSDCQPSPPSDIQSENVDRQRRRRITKSTPQDPPSHPPRERAKKLTLRVPPRRK